MAWEEGDTVCDWWYDRDSKLYFTIILKKNGKLILNVCERQELDK